MICTPYVYVLPSTCSYHNAMRQGSKAEGFSGCIIMPLSTLQGAERLQPSVQSMYACVFVARGGYNEVWLMESLVQPVGMALAL